MNLWTRKLAAWLHDPAEKALVLMRDNVGHEAGSLANLRNLLGISANDFDQRADWLAAAADRPQWPFDPDRPRPSWANVRWTERPVLIHPLSGRELALDKLSGVPAQAMRWISLGHFENLIERDGEESVDHRLTLLSFWRFGPTSPARDIGALWQLLPADTRVPDHSIWQHLDAVSALAGAMHDDEPALLTVSIGPVQGFIAQARSTSDLWAGSHLLASLAWEAMKPIVEALGPDAVLFPALRGVPIVDLWLLEQAGASRRDAWMRRFADARSPWVEGPVRRRAVPKADSAPLGGAASEASVGGRDSDENALFSAALPNKFTAIVPRSRARDLADRATRSVRDAALGWALDAAGKLFDKVQRDPTHALGQVREQLAGFPEVHWGLAEWPTAQRDDGLPDAAPLQRALAAFDAERDAPPSRGFFASTLWRMLDDAELVQRQSDSGKVYKTLRIDQHDFFQANAGVLYPAVHALSELALAAAKACRPFDALDQHGFRCTVTGEAEWLTDDPDPKALETPRGQRQNTVWTDIAAMQPSWAKPGEHLGALATLKRLWPTLYAERLETALPGRRFRRMPISTHALALAPSIELLVDGEAAYDSAARDRIAQAVEPFEDALLPRSLARSLARKLHGQPPEFERIARRLPAALETLEGDDRERVERDLEKLLGHRHETYYAIVKLDGDHMGQWLAGDDTATQLRFAQTWHPQVRAEVEQLARRSDALKRYVDAPRPASPARHMFVSNALNHFSQQVARHVVEDICKGRLIYAGGDDLLAMVAVDDLLPALILLRAAYSGDGEAGGLPRDLRQLRIGRDHVALDGRLLPTMGAKATLSAGAVVAHYTAPLAHVLRCVDDAEKQAKAGGRNRWRLRIMKRGGGEVAIDARFWKPTENGSEAPALEKTPAGFVLRLAETLAETEFSRRALYAATEWLAALPPRGDAVAKLTDDDWRAMVEASLGQQFERQGGLREHAREAVEIACSETEGTACDTRAYLSNLLLAAEFFGRQRRASRGRP